MAKIDCTGNLPKWFDLANYKDAESFGAIEWLEQLWRRQEVLELHPERVSHVTAESTQDWRGFVSEFWRLSIRKQVQKIRERPLESPSEGRINESFSALESQPIKSVSVRDLAWQMTRDEFAEDDGRAVKGISKRWAAINPSSISVWDFVDYADSRLVIDYYREGRPEIPIVQIDLGASDSVLKEAFANWLKDARAGQRPGDRKPRRSLYERWARYGLLPYLDLWIWGMETESHIPDRVMSAAISHYDGGEANLRKTISPLATDLMLDLSELQALAAVEAMSRTSNNPEVFDG